MTFKILSITFVLLTTTSSGWAKTEAGYKVTAKALDNIPKVCALTGNYTLGEKTASVVQANSALNSFGRATNENNNTGNTN